MGIRKQLEHAGPDEAVTIIARHAMRLCLSPVVPQLKLAAESPADEVESVHQMRVATRRAQACLTLFGSTLAKGRRQRLARRLKTLRKVAGAARDLDVLLARLGPRMQDVPRSPLQAIFEDLRKRRRAARKPIKKAWKQAQRANWAEYFDETVERVRWRSSGPEPIFQNVARRELQPLVDAFLREGDRDVTSSKQLHELRLAGKRLRYAIELLSGAFDSTLRDQIYPVFRSVQQQLGEIIDHEVAREIFEGWLVQSDDDQLNVALTRLVSQESTSLDNAVDAFRRKWTSEMIDGLRRDFDHLLEPIAALPARSRANGKAPKRKSAIRA